MPALEKEPLDAEFTVIDEPNRPMTYGEEQELWWRSATWPQRVFVVVATVAVVGPLLWVVKAVLDWLIPT